MGTLSVPTEHCLTTFFFFAAAILNSLGAPFGRPVPRSRRLLGHPPPRPHTILPYVPRNSLKGAGSALGVRWVGGFNHCGGRVRRGLEWVCAMSCPRPGRCALRTARSGVALTFVRASLLSDLIGSAHERTSHMAGLGPLSEPMLEAQAATKRD